MQDHHLGSCQAMPKQRFIEFEGQIWRLGALAQSRGLACGTLYARIERFGETATGIARALATGIMSKEAAGRRGANKSCWRYRGSGGSLLGRADQGDSGAEKGPQK